MTDDEFKRLPPLISRAQFLEATGLKARELSHLVAAGEIKTWHARKNGYAKYYKRDAEQIMEPAQ